jgi:predicted pyridoxine 5'-phosphate oxidase superfamily flavin-nucleotide-binding protein
MAYRYAEIAFTDTVKERQEHYGSRRQFQRLEAASPGRDVLGPGEAAFVGGRDSIVMASVGETGWPYVQHRGGPKGFLKVLDDKTIAFADFRGNRQYVSTGNLLHDSRVALLLLDLASGHRLKILGRARICEAEAVPELIARLRVPDYPATIERAVLIEVEAFDWNCHQHITPRFTQDEVAVAVAPLRARLAELETENQQLRDRLNGRSS